MTEMYNANIQVDKASIQFSRFTEGKNISQLFNDNGSVTKWHEFKREYDLHENYVFQKNGILSLKKEKENAADLIIHDHHLIKDSRDNFKMN